MKKITDKYTNNTFENIKNSYDLIKDKLNGQSNTIIVRYCIIKMLTIENILAKFKIQRYGYFRRWLTRLENGAFLRISLSVFRNENVLRPFMEMVKEYPDAKDINLNKSNLSIVEELCKKEAVKDGLAERFSELKVGDVVVSGPDADIKPGNASLVPMDFLVNDLKIGTEVAINKMSMNEVMNVLTVITSQEKTKEIEKEEIEDELLF